MGKSSLQQAQHQILAAATNMTVQPAVGNLLVQQGFDVGVEVMQRKAISVK